MIDEVPDAADGTPALRPGVRLGIDVGKARIGVARSDPQGTLAVPVETVARDRRGDGHVRRLLELAREYEAIELIVGLPLNLEGRRTPSTDDALSVTRDLTAGPVPVRLLDERLTTVQAAAQFHATGRSASRSRQVIDQAAAVILLQDALDRERAGHGPAGFDAVAYLDQLD